MQRTRIEYLDKAKQPVAKAYDYVCFAGFPRILPKETYYLNYKPTKVSCKHDIGEKYYKFLRELWHFRGILYHTSYSTLVDKGVNINATRWNAFQFYSCCVALRYLFEMPGLLKDWTFYSKHLNQFEAFIACHSIRNLKYQWNSGHSLIQDQGGWIIEGANPAEMEAFFPDYRGLPMTKYGDIYQIPPKDNQEENQQQERVHGERGWRLHDVFKRPEKFYVGVHPWVNHFMNVDMSLFKQILPLKAESIFNETKTSDVQPNSTLLFF
jgi:hypothetical protein